MLIQVTSLTIVQDLMNPENLLDIIKENALPPCFGELHSLTIDCADVSRQRKKPDTGDDIHPRKSNDYARGYLHPYTEEAWEQWLQRFSSQANSKCSKRTGKKTNKRGEHGLALYDKSLLSYTAVETQLYSCAYGGKPRRKDDQVRSKMLGCPAILETKTIIIDDDWKVLEVTAPKFSAHLPVHFPPEDD